MLEHTVIVTEPPKIKGPYPVIGDPCLAEYTIIARLSLPAADTEVVPSVEIRETSQNGECIDVRWTTGDTRTPRGIWERSAVVTIPRQFAVTGCTLRAEVSG